MWFVAGFGFGSVLSNEWGWGGGTGCMSHLQIRTHLPPLQVETMELSFPSSCQCLLLNLGSKGRWGGSPGGDSRQAQLLELRCGYPTQEGSGDWLGKVGEDVARVELLCGVLGDTGGGKGQLWVTFLSHIHSPSPTSLIFLEIGLCIDPFYRPVPCRHFTVIIYNPRY